MKAFLLSVALAGVSAGSSSAEPTPPKQLRPRRLEAGATAREGGRLGELERTAEQAKNPRERAEAKEAVGLFLCEIGFFDEAEEWLRSALGDLSSARSAMPLYVRCRVEQRLELYGDALRTSAALMSAEGDLGRWAARSHARCLERLGRAPELVRFAAEQASRSTGEETWWELARARALVKLGRTDEATAVCERLRSAGGKEAELAAKVLLALSLRPRVEKLAARMGVRHGRGDVRVIIRLAGFGERTTAFPRERPLTPVLTRGLDEALEAYQPRPLLGVTVGGAGAEPVGGALVRAVERGSPAEKLGLDRGDVITSFDGVDLSKWGPFARVRLADLVGSARPGQKVDIRWRRGEETHTGDMVLVDYTR